MMKNAKRLLLCLVTLLSGFCYLGCIRQTIASIDVEADITLIETVKGAEDAWRRVVRNESRSDGATCLEIRALLFTSILKHPDKYREFWNNRDPQSQSLLRAVLRDGHLCYLTLYGTNDIPNWELRLTNAVGTIGVEK